MLLTVFLIFLVLSLFLLFMGYFAKEGLYSLAGGIILFILGSSFLISGDLQIPIGESKNTSNNYVCACCNNGSILISEIVTGGTCSGDPFTCDYYNGSFVNCLLAGCSYNETSEICEGTPELCTLETIERDCEARNCTWENVTSDTCTEGAEIVLYSQQEVKVKNYQNFDGTTARSFGFFLALMAAFIVAITINEIRGLKP